MKPVPELLIDKTIAKNDSEPFARMIYHEVK
jgi:hypothetical protein